MPMTLQSLHVDKVLYGEQKGQYKAIASFTSSEGSMTVHLPADKMQCVMRELWELMGERFKDGMKDVLYRAVEDANVG